MPETIPGKLEKQGPIATLEGTIGFSDGDKFLFTGEQFVHFVASPPKPTEVISYRTLSIIGDQVSTSIAYSNYLDSSGEFRLTNGNPVNESGFTGTPSDYDSVVFGYNTEITTDSIKIWSINYIPPSLLGVDYGYDGVHFFAATISSTDFQFDDSLRVIDTEASPSGQYVYTITLDENYTAKYWRVRAFIHSYNTGKTTNAYNQPITLASVLGFPSSSSVYGEGGCYYNDLTTSSGVITQLTSVRNVTPVPGSSNYSAELLYLGTAGTIKAGANVFTGVVSNYGDWFYSANVVSDVAVLDGPSWFSCVLDGRVSSGIDSELAGEDDSEIAALGRRIYANISYSHTGVLSSPVVYSSIVSNSLQGVQVVRWGTSYDVQPGRTFFYRYNIDLTQVNIVSQDTALLRYWESDGSKSVTNIVDTPNIYDVVFDTHDNAYYCVVYESNGGIVGNGFSDNFSSGDSSLTFDSSMWTSAGVGLYRDDVSGCLVFSTPSGLNYYSSITSYPYLTGSFVSELDSEVTLMSGTGFFGQSFIDNNLHNHYGGVYLAGEWGATNSGSVVAFCVSEFGNYTNSSTQINGLWFNPYTLLEGVYKHTFVYSSASWEYTRTNLVSPGVWEVVGENVGTGPLIDGGFMSFAIDTASEPPACSFVTFTTTKATISGIGGSSVSLRATYDSTSGLATLEYDDGALSSILAGAMYGEDFAVGIVGANSNYTTISSTLFEATGPVLWDRPNLKVVALDIEGNLVEVENVTSESGVAINILDVLGSSSVEFDDFYKNVSIATNNLPYNSGGSLFIRVGEDIYLYEKDSLPLLSREDGSSALVGISGSVPDSNIRHFSYDDYDNGGLSYIYEDSSRYGIFITSVSSSTLERTYYEAELDVSAYTNPLARDPVDYSVLYTLVGNDVYVFNTAEDSVAFCNVVSSEPIIPASSNYSSLITAVVTNLYGDPLSNKRVNFAITAGAGTISPAYSCTTASGVATAVFTAGPVEGTSVITATATNTAC